MSRYRKYAAVLMFMAAIAAALGQLGKSVINYSPLIGMGFCVIFVIAAAIMAFKDLG